MARILKARYVRALDAASYLGLIDSADPDETRARRRAVNALYQRVHRGEITCHRFGRRLRFCLEDLDAHMQRRGGGAATAGDSMTAAGAVHWARHLRAEMNGEVA